MRFPERIKNFLRNMRHIRDFLKPIFGSRKFFRKFLKRIFIETGNCIFSFKLMITWLSVNRISFKHHSSFSGSNTHERNLYAIFQRKILWFFLKSFHIAQHQNMKIRTVLIHFRNLKNRLINITSAAI